MRFLLWKYCFISFLLQPVTHPIVVRPCIVETIFLKYEFPQVLLHCQKLIILFSPFCKICLHSLDFKVLQVFSLHHWTYFSCLSQVIPVSSYLKSPLYSVQINWSRYFLTKFKLFCLCVAFITTICIACIEQWNWLLVADCENQSHFYSHIIFDVFFLKRWLDGTPDLQNW